MRCRGDFEGTEEKEREKEETGDQGKTGEKNGARDSHIARSPRVRETSQRNKNFGVQLGSLLRKKKKNKKEKKTIVNDSLSIGSF